MRKMVTLLFFMVAVSTASVSHALETDEKESGALYEALTFSTFSVEIYPASTMGRYNVNYSRWVGNLRAAINLTFGDKVAGAILFVEDRTALPPPEDQPKRGGYVLYYHWREYWEIFNMLTTYKGIGTYGSVFRKSYDDGAVIYGLDFSQIALEKNRRLSR